MFNLFDSGLRAMESASTYVEWKEGAQLYDQKHGHDHWKRVDMSHRYDYLAIRERLDRLRALRANHDDHGLLFSLNEGIHGNMGGMGRNAVYQKARFGTKNLIADYVDEVATSLEYLSSRRVRKIPVEAKLDFFKRASHCYGRSALMLSGAGTLLYFHLGVVKALLDQNILPSVISGASGGALVAAMIGTHSREELAKIFDPEYIKIEIKRDMGLQKYFNPFRSQMVPTEEVRALFSRLIPDLTFEEAYKRSGVHINITVAPADRHQTSRLLNAMTSPNVMIREAVLASCAVPGFYPAVTLAAKNVHGERQPYLPNRRWIDGSVSDDFPIKRLMRLYGVNHFIASLTNPAVLPFARGKKEQTSVFDIAIDTGIKVAKEVAVAGSKVIQRQMGAESPLTRVSAMLASVISQDYTGDINLLPPSRAFNPLRVLSPRSEEEIIEMIAEGERATWPELEKIRIQTTISRKLDEVMRNMELDMLRQPEDLRLIVDGKPAS